MGKESDLMSAVKHGDVAAVRKALQKHKMNKNKKQIQKMFVSVKQPDSDGFSVLHHAALSGNVEVVLALIEMEADINARDKKGMCPLHMASWAGKDAVVKTLVDSKALVNLPSYNGETALHLGAQHGYGSVVDVLLKSKADPTLRNNNFETPLDLACQYGHSLVVRILLRHDGVLLMLQCRQQDPRYKSPLHVSARTGHVDIVRMLLECGADVNEDTPDGTCLHEAALFGKSDVVRLLLEAGADVGAVNKSGMTPLDIVNKFTSSRAAGEIKQLLREASGESVVFAKAIMNYKNPHDSATLTFNAGEIIMVVEQKDNGMWKGSLQNDREARVGTFPSTTVHVLGESALSHSGGSSMSSVDSSLSGSSARDQQAMTKDVYHNKLSPKSTPKPVGMVPIGTYEVVALATAQPAAAPKKQQPPIPRMSSFKKKSPPRNRKEQAAAAPDERPTVPGRSSRQHEPVANGIHTRRSTNPVEMHTGNGDVSHASNARPDSYDAVKPRTRSTSGSVTQHDLAYAAKLALDKKLHPVPNGEHVTSDSSEAMPKPPDDITVNRSTKPTMDKQQHVPTSYTSVVVGNSTDSDAHGSERGSALRVSKKVKEEGYEEMRFDRPPQVPTKLVKSPPEVKKRQKTIMRSGYEDMTKGPNDASSDAPALPRKTSGQDAISTRTPSIDVARPAPQPPKVIESKAINRRQDSYENVLPRVQPVLPASPFNGSHEQSTYKQPSASASYSTPVAIPNNELKSNPESHEYRNVNVNSNAESETPMEYSVPTQQPLLRHVKLPDQGSVRYKSPLPVSPGCSSPTSSVGSNPDFEQAYLKLIGTNLNEDARAMLDWLREIKLGHYFENFHAEGYDMTGIRGITPDDLTDIGIVKVGHRKKLLSQIAKLPPCSSLPAKKPHNVAIWLESLGMALYEPNFIEGGFDDIDFIKDLDRHDLETIEIKKRGHQKKLLQAVRNLSDLDLTASLDNVIGENSFPSPIPSPLSPHSPIHYDENPSATRFPLVVDPTLQAFLAPTSPSSYGFTSQSSEDAPPALPKKRSNSGNNVLIRGDEAASSLSPAISPRPAVVSPSRGSLKGSGKPKIQLPSKPSKSRDSSPNMTPRSPMGRVMDEGFRSRTTSAPAPKTKPKPKAQQNLGQVRTEAEVLADPSGGTSQPRGDSPLAADRSRLHSDVSIQRSYSAVVRPSDSAKVLPVKLPKPKSMRDRANSNPPDLQDTKPKQPPPVVQKKPGKQKKDDAAAEDKETARLSPQVPTAIPETPTTIAKDPEPEVDLLQQVLNEQEEMTSSSETTTTNSQAPAADDTEMLMADLDNIINDFSTQLDSMFD